MSNEELVGRIQRGEGDTAELMQELYAQNRGLIYKTVQPYATKNGNSIEDLMQDAYLAMNEAVQRYEPDKGASFATYLPYWLKQTARGSQQSTDALMRLPAYLRNRVQSYQRACAAYESECGQAAPDSYIRRTLDLSQDQLDNLRDVIRKSGTRSLSEPVPGFEGLTLGDAIADDRDLIGDICDDLDRQQAAADLWGAVDKLPNTQADAIRIRFADGMSVRQTAEQLQITEGQARGAIDQGLRKLQKSAAVRRAADTYEYWTSELYCGSLGRFRHEGSAIEAAVIRKLEGPPRREP